MVIKVEPPYIIPCRLQNSSIDFLPNSNLNVRHFNFEIYPSVSLVVKGQVKIKECIFQDFLKHFKILRWVEFQAQPLFKKSGLKIVWNPYQHVRIAINFHFLISEECSSDSDHSAPDYSQYLKTNLWFSHLIVELLSFSFCFHVNYICMWQLK